MKNNKGKKWIAVFLGFFITILLCTGGMTALIDPYFHYHKPLKGLQYRIHNERYQNNGIVKNFDYDAIITGTSMTENFKASQFNELFDVKSVKVPFSGASYKEINENLDVAFRYNDNIKVVLRCLDYNAILLDKDWMRYDDSFYPHYLYDEKLYNDVLYWFNKDVFINETLYTLWYTSTGQKTTNFDEYVNWSEKYTYGKDTVENTFQRAEKAGKIEHLSKEERDTIRASIDQNVTSLAKENPNIEFYLFFSPYSIYFFDRLNQNGTLEKQLDAEKYVLELLLPYDNIHMFSFFGETDMICNLDNYKDVGHYGGKVNEHILNWMAEGHDELTLDNYEEYCEKEREFYLNYDYDRLYDN